VIGNGIASHDHEVDLEEAFDFLNTYELESGSWIEHLQTPNQAFEWIKAHDVVHGSLLDEARTRLSADPAAAERVLGKIRRVRDALRNVAYAVAEDRPAPATALAEVNRALRAREIIELEPAADGIRVGHRHVGDPVDDALARLAQPVVQAIATGHEDRFRICANDECRWVFYDESPTGRRRWCDMSTCGNRAKAARHRAKKRAAESAAEGATEIKLLD
jgi:predicted RNA-binding Zn ribbon-like protein